MTADLTSTARLDRPAPAVAVDAWNARYPVGTPVAAYPGVRPDEYPGVDCTRLTTFTRSAAQVLGGHTAVVWVEGHSACIALTHVDVRPLTPEEQRLAAGVAAEMHHLYLDLDPDSAVRLPDSIPACLPAGVDPPGGGRNDCDR